MQITPAQALAFVESLVGWDAISEEIGRPKSPHARTHLEAVLGQNQIPWSRDVDYALECLKRPESRKYYKDTFVRLLHFAEYLAAIAEVIQNISKE